MPDPRIRNAYEAILLVRAPVCASSMLSVLMLLDALGMSLYLLGVSVWLPTPFALSRVNSTHPVHVPVS